MGKDIKDKTEEDNKQIYGPDSCKPPRITPPFFDFDDEIPAYIDIYPSSISFPPHIREDEKTPYSNKKPDYKPLKKKRT